MPIEGNVGYIANGAMNILPVTVASAVYDNKSDMFLDRVLSKIQSSCFSSYTCTKEGTVFLLVGSGDNIKFNAPSDYKTGDIFKIKENATASEIILEAKTQDGEILQENCFKSGAVVQCFKNGTTLNFKSGSAMLNFSIVGGTTQPTTPRENTIWVNTTVVIGEYRLMGTAPTTRRDGNALQLGDIWIQYDNAKGMNISIIKDNSIMIRPIAAYQFIGNAWVEKPIKLYINKKWGVNVNATNINQWYWKKYGQNVGFPRPSNFSGAHSSSGYRDDSSLSINMGFGDNYSMWCTTHLFLDEDANLNIGFTTDDGGTVTLNDIFLGDLTSCAERRFICNFKAGWNKLEVCYTEGGGGDGWTTNPRLFNHSLIKKMAGSI